MPVVAGRTPALLLLAQVETDVISVPFSRAPIVEPIAKILNISVVVVLAVCAKR